MVMDHSPEFWLQALIYVYMGNWQMILMKYHTLFLSKIKKDVSKFVVC